MCGLLCFDTEYAEDTSRMNWISRWKPMDGRIIIAQKSQDSMHYKHLKP